MSDPPACWGCGQAYEPDPLAILCEHCGVNLFTPAKAPQAAVAQDQALALDTTGSPGEPALQAPAADTKPRAAAERGGTPARELRPANDSTPRTPMLILPGGVRVPIPPGRLEIGRECGTEAVDVALEPYVDVSRRHAVITRTGPRLLLTEIKDGTFGTEMDGRRLAPFVPVPLRPGAQIRLASHCYLSVEESDD